MLVSYREEKFLTHCGRYVFTLRNPLKDLSADHDVVGIVAKMELAL
jgi:hypothetical protein